MISPWPTSRPSSFQRNVDFCLKGRWLKLTGCPLSSFSNRHFVPIMDIITSKSRQSNKAVEKLLDCRPQGVGYALRHPSDPNGCVCRISCSIEWHFCCQRGLCETRWCRAEKLNTLVRSKGCRHHERTSRSRLSRSAGSSRCHRDGDEESYGCDGCAQVANSLDAVVAHNSATESCSKTDAEIAG